MRLMTGLAVLLMVACALGLAWAGIAQAASPDDRATTEAVLRDVEGGPRKDVVAEMTARSRAALARAASLRSAGDEPRAKLADGLARTWAEAARDVARAVDVEEKAQAARRSATDAGASAERERALLEEGIAQTGRIRAELEGVERDAKEQPARTSAAANSDLDGGAGKPRPRTMPKNGPSEMAPPAVKDGGAR
jgi:hypothetical protein